MRKVVLTNVTNIVLANISPRVQKEIIGFIGESVGKHRQYIGKIKNTKILKNTKNYYTFEKIAKYRHKIGKYRYILEKIGKYRDQIEKKSPKNRGKYRGDILSIYRL